MVSWCGSESTLDLVLPTYIYSGQIVDYQLRDATIHSTGSSVPWSEKKDKAVFRGRQLTSHEQVILGRDSNQLRLDLARLSHKEEDNLIDAGITAYFFFDESKNSPRTKRMPFDEFFSVSPPPVFTSTSSTSTFFPSMEPWPPTVFPLSSLELLSF